MVRILLALLFATSAGAAPLLGDTQAAPGDTSGTARVTDPVTLMEISPVGWTAGPWWGRISLDSTLTR